MSSSIKLTSLLALAGAVAAVPHYQHQKFHHRAAYPVGGWGGSNSTVPAGATGTGVYGEPTTTIDTTSTSTETLYSTVFVKPSSVPGVHEANVADASSGVCGGTVTVTAKEKVTVTVTPGGGVVAAPPTSSPAGNGYGASVPASAETPVQSPPAPEYPVEESQPPSPSKPAESAVPSKPAEYPVETPKSPAPSKPAETPAYTTSATPASSSPAASPSPSGFGLGNMYTGTKRGLAYNDAELCSSFGSNFGFAYNWAQVENNDIGTQFIPMMHKPSDSTAEAWLANVDKAVKKGTRAVMGFNECDIAAQCNLSPEAACSAWKEYMNPVKEAHPDLTIIGPSVSNGQAPLGLDWLTRFHDACPDAKVDATNIHFYDVYDDKTIERFKAHIEKSAEIYGNKLWVSEFGLNPGSATQEQAASFLKDCMAYLDTSDKVQGYSWFMVGTGENQLNLDDGLSPIGKVYAGSA